MTAITPALGIAGVLLIGSGLAYALIGVKIPRLQIFLSSFLLSALSVTVLIVYLTQPPISAAIQGAYLVAAVMTGAILGGVAVIFPEMTEKLGCLLGGYCFAMWLLVLKPDGLIAEQYGRVILIGGFCAVMFGLAFWEKTRPGVVIFSLAFSGGTAVVLGIDCFARAGLKEFWLYIWNLNDDLFPPDMTTFQHTRGMKVELAGIVLLAIVGVMTQIQLWKIIKDRNSQREAAKRQEEAEREEHDLEMGRRVEKQCETDKNEWEAVYGVTTKETSVQILVCEATGQLPTHEAQESGDPIAPGQVPAQPVASDPVELEDGTYHTSAPLTEDEATTAREQPPEKLPEQSTDKYPFLERKRRVAEPLLPLPPNPADEARYCRVHSAKTMISREQRYNRPTTEDDVPEEKLEEVTSTKPIATSVDPGVISHEPDASVATGDNYSYAPKEGTFSKITEKSAETKVPDTLSVETATITLLRESISNLEPRLPEAEEMEAPQLDTLSGTYIESEELPSILVTTSAQKTAAPPDHQEAPMPRVTPEPEVEQRRVDTVRQHKHKSKQSVSFEDYETPNPPPPTERDSAMDSTKLAPPPPLRAPESGTPNPQINILPPTPTPTPVPTPGPTRSPTPTTTRILSRGPSASSSPPPRPRPTSPPTLLDERELILRNRASLTLLPPSPTLHRSFSASSLRRTSTPYTPLSYTYTPPLEDDDMPLSRRRELLRRQSASPPPPARTPTPLTSRASQPNLQSVRLRNWRESLKADQRRATMEMMADRGRARMIEAKCRELKRVPGPSQSGLVERNVDPVERVHRSGMNKAHREAMRKLQGKANQRL